MSLLSPQKGHNRPKWVKMLSKLLKTQSKGVKRGQNGLKGVKIASKWVPMLQKCDFEPVEGHLTDFKPVEGL